MADVPARGRRHRTLEELLAQAGRSTAVESIELLSIGWPGRGQGTYRDDDGTHARVRLADGTTAIFREYAATNRMVRLYQEKERFVLELVRDAGLPAPRIEASVEGAVLLEDPGGEPLEVMRDRPVWASVGRALRQLHDVDISAGDLWLGDRPWMHPIPYLIRNLRRRGVPPSKAALALLRGPVADHLDARPRSICCGGYSLPGMLLDDGGGDVVGWLSLGYYVSIGDPDRDVVGIGTHHPLPDEFFDAYGRRPDPVAAVVYSLLHGRDTDGIDDAFARLVDLVGARAGDGPAAP
jgi:hypothetical protein